MKVPTLHVLTLMLASALPAVAHEFWIQPQDYAVETGAAIRADLRVGQEFKGAAFSYIPQNSVRFDIVSGDTVIPVDSRIGDRPALDMAAPGDGLWIVVHETTDSSLTWDSWEKFVDFVEQKKLDGVLSLHAERDLPQEDVKERYRRFAKALVAVGEGSGADREVGLRTEIVALANPYTDDLPGGLPVRVLYQGEPREEVQIEIFDRDPEGMVSIRTEITDAEGVASIPVEAGHEYLLDSVTMLPLAADDAAESEVWESLWASLTFRVPAPGQ